MKHLYDTTYRSRERPVDTDLPNLTARLPEAGADAGIIAHRRRMDGQGWFVTHELAEEAPREADASGIHGHQPVGPFEGSQPPPEPPAGDSRPNGAPAYYLGRPASLWLSIFSPRRNRTAPNHAIAGHRQRTLSQDTGPITGRGKRNGVSDTHQRLIGDDSSLHKGTAAAL